MNNKSKSSKVDGLLAALQRKTPSTPESPAEQQPEPSAVVVTAPESPPKVVAIRPKKSRVGKPVQFWLHDEDRRLVRELAAWLAGQGERPTDSLVIRSALRMTHTGSDLLKAYRQASQLDGRLKQHKNA
jgi:hypothetical protein